MKSNFKKYLIIVLTLSIACVSALMLSSCGTASEANINPITGETVEDGDLLAKPVIVSIPNAADGAVPQSGISKADIIYEFPVEGQITRLQAVFYSETPDIVGPCRSVRYYFVDLAREYQANHVGYGWGKKAHKYMTKSHINHINGMEDWDLFDRVDFKDAPNDAYITWDKIEARAEEEGWFDETADIQAWKFRDEEWEELKEGAQKIIDKKSDSDDPEDIAAVRSAEGLLADSVLATSISVKSASASSECKYDAENNCYKRYWYGDPYIDRETSEQLEFANILVQFVESDFMKDETTGLVDEKGRLEIDMNSSGDALLFTNGEVIKGTWSKADADSRTIFIDEYGNEFRFTQGKTWCYVCDQYMNCSYK